MAKYTFKFEGEIEVEGKTREEAIAKVCGRTSMKKAAEVNDQILENVNFTF